jgi:hypothetical protein
MSDVSDVSDLSDLSDSDAAVNEWIQPRQKQSGVEPPQSKIHIDGSVDVDGEAIRGVMR